MERRSRSIESPRRRAGPRRDYRRYSRSRSRERSREHNFRRKSTRSRSREPPHYRRSAEKDLYRDLIYDDYREDKNYTSSRGGFWDDRGYERELRDRGEHVGGERDRSDRKDYRSNRHAGNSSQSNRHYNSRDRDIHSDDSDDESAYNSHYYNKTPSNTVIALGLQPQVTEADIMSLVVRKGLAATSIRLIRKRNSGSSQGFAFVEFNTIDEAARWMELTQSTLDLYWRNTRASLQFSHSREQHRPMSDWYCGKCGVLNFRHRDSCFKCYASREESEEGGGGSDEVSNILTKKIMLRNLDALTNEESVLSSMQQHSPDLAKKISKILISRDELTQTSRGICYLNFESLVDSMNLHKSLNALDPPLKIDNRDVQVSYCIDHENRHIVPKKSTASEASIALVNAASGSGTVATAAIVGPMTAAEMAASSISAAGSITSQYTLADVPRLAEYSAAMYASTPAEHAHYLQYYTEYYVSEITKGQFANLPPTTIDSQISETSANSGAAVALSAIQRKQKKMSKIETTATQAAMVAAAKAKAKTAQTIVTPKGNDGKTYPIPDVTQYQYDESSGYYYDPTTGLYYDAHSQYYYNNETGAYLYWDQRKITYVLATPAAAAASVQDVLKHETGDDTTKQQLSSSSSTGAATEDDATKKEKEKKEGGGLNKHDKVKVAKKIVKDMEKWAKQLNQKKDYTVVATPQPILPSPKGGDDSSALRLQPTGISGGYADVGFSILEKKERAKLADYQISPALANSSNKLVSAYGCSDSDDEHHTSAKSSSSNATAATGLVARGNAATALEASEKDCVDFQKLTCLLCKRAFQSLDILQKHLKMSNLHKENLQKYNLARAETDADADMTALALSYRDRAKERRLKYGECDPPPPNRSRERFQNEIKSLSARQSETAPAMPIGSNNVGNRLLQKMGWSEGQGLGRKNQGRTNIIEPDARSSTAGLGTKSGITPGDDYKTYIKKMMKSRYESV